MVLRQAQTLLSKVGLGGSAVGTGVNTHPKYQKIRVKHLSGISRREWKPARDLRYAMQSNLTMSVVSAALGNLALELIRITSDLHLLSSGPNTGLAEIALPALLAGSSSMPGKGNPFMAELTAMVGVPRGCGGHGDSPGSAGGPTRMECHDAGHGLECAPLGGDSEKHDACASNPVRGRDRGQQGTLPLARECDDFDGGSFEPLYGVRRCGGAPA